MRRSTRVTTKKILVASDSSDEDVLESRLQGISLKKQSPSVNKAEDSLKPNNSDSSSESDIENYLKPAHQIDFNSSFFQTSKFEETKSFEAIEKNIFSGINKLSDSDSEIEEENETVCTEKQDPKPTTSKVNFQQLHDYTQKIEEAKRLVEKYEAQKKRKLKNNKHKSVKNKKPDEDLDISELLALGETKVDLTKLQTSTNSSDFESFSDSEKEDWEEVKEGEGDDVKESIIPKGGVQITVQLPGMMQKKKGVDLVACMKRRLNRIRKENQVYVHKVHLLCWLGHGNYVNRVLNNQELLALALSLIPSQHCYPSDRTDLNYLEQIVTWFNDTVPVMDKLYSKEEPLEKLLKIQINRKRAFNKKMLVYMFVCVLRSLGIQCRLVLSFQVAPLRPPASELHSLSTKNEESKNNKVVKDDSRIKGESSKKNSKSEGSAKTKTKNPTTESEKTKNKEKKSQPKKITKQNNTHQSTSSKIPQVDGAGDTDDTETPASRKIKKPNLKKLMQEEKDSCPIKKHSKRLKSAPTPKETKTERNSNNNNKTPPSTSKSSTTTNLKKLKSSESKPSTNIKKSVDKAKAAPHRSSQSLDRSQYFGKKSSPQKQSGDVRNDIISIMKGRMAQERATEHSKLVKSKRRHIQNNYDYDSDYAPDTIKKKKPDSDDEFHKKNKVKVKRRVKVRKEGDEEEEKVKKGVDVWVEVFLESEEKWISADVVKGKVHCIKELYSRTTHPVTYIVAWNNDNALKDITQRYCPNWNTVTRKLRIDKKWWQNSLRPFEGRKTARDREEDEELSRLQLDQPLPTSIAEYKNHPLYVLKRHLLKFEALYPPQPITLGFVKNEAVYPRDCVHVLHSREVWIKYAKVVKPGEQPYKVVKARSKYDKLSGKVISDLPLELFGKWQINDYIPPTAENGIVPRNGYGNVDLFKPTMLPKGTVHLQLPGLNKTAKKLNIDCAPAVVGFDFHSGGSHPTFDGFVVCEEYSEILVSAWFTEQEEQEKKGKEKAEKRIYGNWKKLIKGLLIRERLKARYDFGGSTKMGNKKQRSKEARLVSKKRRICSDSESDVE